MTNEVEVYYNNHKKCFSVKRANGKLLFHATGVVLANPTLKVNWKGAQRVLRLNRKEVFARIRGEYWSSSDEGRGPEATEAMGRFYRYFTDSEYAHRVVTAKVNPRLGFHDILTGFPLTKSGVDPVWAMVYLLKDTAEPRILLDYDDNAADLYEDQENYLHTLGMQVDAKDVWHPKDMELRRAINDKMARHRERMNWVLGEDNLEFVKEMEHELRYGYEDA